MTTPIPPLITPSAAPTQERRSGAGWLWLFRPVRLEACRSTCQFIFRILTQQFAAKVIAGVLIGLFIPNAGLTDRSALLRDPALALILLVLVAPPVETLLLQAAPIEILRSLGRSRRFQFLGGSIPFAALHFAGGVGSGIAAGIIGGISFSHTYLEGRSRSWWTALRITTITHGLHNLVCLPVILLLPG